MQDAFLPPPTGIEMSSGPTYERGPLFKVLQGLGATLGMSAESPSQRMAPGTDKSAGSERRMASAQETEYVVLPESTRAKAVWPPMSPLGKFDTVEHPRRPHDLKARASQSEPESSRPAAMPTTNPAAVSHSPAKNYLRPRVGGTADGAAVEEPRPTRSGQWNVATGHFQKHLNFAAGSRVPSCASAVSQWENIPLGAATSSMTESQGDHGKQSAKYWNDEKQDVTNVKDDEQGGKHLNKQRRMLEENPHPFSCAEAVHKQTDCREDGRLPNQRLPSSIRVPCLLFYLSGGRCRAESDTTVVCSVSLDKTCYHSLAAPVSDQNCFSSSCVFTFPLNAKQLHHEHGSKLKVVVRQDAEVIGGAKFELSALLDLAIRRKAELTTTYLLEGSESDKSCIHFSVELTGDTTAWAPLSFEDLLKTVDEDALTESILDDDDEHAMEKISRMDGYSSSDGSEGFEQEREDLHWRERLERAMDSLVIIFLVMLLVVVDVLLAIVFDLSNQDAEPRAFVAVTVTQAVILFAFGLELILKYVAKRKRFWTGWNLFDLIVVLMSYVVFRHISICICPLIWSKEFAKDRHVAQEG